MRRGSVGFLLYCLIMGLAACAADDMIDTSVVPPDAPPALQECDPATTELQHNVYHCGACDHRCNLDNADRCINGTCVCGTEPDCGDGFDCRAARCITFDPEGRNCEFDPECPAGYGCIEAHCTSLDCVDEVCDGFDNDCDGEVDEGDSPGDAPLAQYCGAPLTILPPCRPGVQVCVDGEWGACLGGILPVAEVGLLLCNDLDDNCDGCVDSTLSVTGICERRPSETYDIVFVVDVSGSMGAHILRVKAAVASFSSTYAGSPDYAFALVTTGYRAPPHPNIEINLTTTYADFAAAVTGIDHRGLGTEGNWDGPYLSMTGGLRVDRLSDDTTGFIEWREGATRIIVTITDEAGQSYIRPPIVEADVCAVATGGEVLVFFTPLYRRPDFDDCGLWFDLSDYSAFAPNLSSVFTDPCP